MARECISSESKFEIIAELPAGAVAHGPHHFTRILDRRVKTNRSLQWLEKASLQTPNLNDSLTYQELHPLDTISSPEYGIGA